MSSVRWEDPCPYKHSEGKHSPTKRGVMCKNCGAVSPGRVDATPIREADAAFIEFEKSCHRLDGALGSGIGLTPGLMPFLVEFRSRLQAVRVKESALKAQGENNGVPAKAEW
jgi:hypothetical protein